MIEAVGQESAVPNERPIVIDCSVPPSANRLWRIGKNKKTGKRYLFKTQRYQRWMWGFFVHVRHPSLGMPKIEGPFDIEILICPERKRDADNSAKALLDACQTIGLIANDSQARKVTQELVDKAKAPLGCRLRIIPL